MAFEWREYLNVATFLQGNAGRGVNAEAALRSATSRSYYAAFCHARNYARDHQNFIPTGAPQDHALVRQHYRAGQQHQLAAWLDMLRQWRNRCDYDDVVQNLAPMAAAAVATAQDVVNRLP